MQNSVKATILSLGNLQVSAIPNGHESVLTESITHRNNKIYLKGIELSQENYFKQCQNFSKFREDLIKWLNQFLETRLLVENEELLSTMEPFSTLDPLADLRKLHEMVAKDLDLPSIHLQYNDLIAAADTNLRNQSLQEILRYLISPQRDGYFRELAIVFSRIIAATPHSADVERCVSANNLLKTTIRNSLLVKTENKYLFVHFNLPELQLWNPRPAVVEWIRKSERRQRDISTIIGKANQQEYFKGVFVKCAKENEADTEPERLAFTF